MSGDDFTYTLAIARQAEHELASYLHAVDQCLGLRDPLHSGHIWIDALESLVWPRESMRNSFAESQSLRFFISSGTPRQHPSARLACHGPLHQGRDARVEK
jgi:hypothetical protein